MHLPFGLYSWLMIAATLAALAGAWLGWRKPSATGARWFALLELQAAIWCFALAFEAVATTPLLKSRWSALQYVGAATMPPVFLMFALQFSRGQGWRVGPRYAALFIIPTIAIGLAATNPLHGWLWPSVTIDPHTMMGIYGHGLFFWIYVGYTYLLNVTGFALLWRAYLRSHAFFRWRTAALLLLSSLPIVGNVIYLSGINPIPGADWTGLGMGLLASLAIPLMQRGRLFDLVPRARDLLVDRMSDAVLILDHQGRIAYLNAAMRAFLPERLQSDDAPLGKTAAQALPPLADVLGHPGHAPSQRIVRIESAEHETRYYDLRTSLLGQGRGMAPGAGTLFVLRDVSESQRLQEERRRLQQQLEASLERVSLLSGLVPICASCKRIRDTEEAWHPVEVYVRDRSDADFSQGLCPDCASRLWSAPDNVS